jgi:hypothetical protein
LDKAPTSLWLIIAAPLIGAICHPGASSRAYTLQPGTIGGKPYWLAEGEDGQTYHFYHVNEPHDGWVVGTDLQSFILIVESYEDTPPWGIHEWNEICAGQQQEVRGITLTPTFTAAECREELRLLSGELTEYCCTEGEAFEDMLAEGRGPDECGAMPAFRYQFLCRIFLTRDGPATRLRLRAQVVRLRGGMWRVPRLGPPGPGQVHADLRRHPRCDGCARPVRWRVQKRAVCHSELPFSGSSENAHRG